MICIFTCSINDTEASGEISLLANFFAFYLYCLKILTIMYLAHHNSTLLRKPVALLRLMIVSLFIIIQIQSFITIIIPDFSLSIFNLLSHEIFRYSSG